MQYFKAVSPLKISITHIFTFACLLLFTESIFQVQYKQDKMHSPNYPQGKQLFKRPYSSYSPPINNGTQYIRNGDFSDTTCTSTQYCIFNINSYDSKNLVDWTPIRDLQIGRGSTYSDSLLNHTKWVVALYSFQPDCIYQNYSQLPTGIYQVSYLHTLRDNNNMSYGNFLFYYNDQPLDQVGSTDYNLHYRNIQIQRLYSSDPFQIKFCSGNFTNNQQSGPILVSVSMKRIDNMACSVANCKLCNISVNICTTCNPYYQNKNTQCTLFNCHIQNCQICANSTSCLQCVAGYNLALNKCQPLFMAIQNCFNYTINFSCSVCLANYELTNNKCILKSSNSSTHPQSIAQNSQLEVLLQNTISSSKVINSIPGLRNYLPFLASIFLFMDEFWYYLYHHNKLKGLTITHAFLNFTLQINQDRLLPQFMNTTFIYNLVDAHDYQVYWVLSWLNLLNLIRKY